MHLIDVSLRRYQLILSNVFQFLPPKAALVVNADVVGLLQLRECFKALESESSVAAWLGEHYSLFLSL